MISLTPRPLFTPGKDPVPIVQEPVWAPGPVWTGAENLDHTGIRFPDRPARSQSLYRLRYQVHAEGRHSEYFQYICVFIQVQSRHLSMWPAYLWLQQYPFPRSSYRQSGAKTVNWAALFLCPLEEETKLFKIMKRGGTTKFSPLPVHFSGKL